jgi:hypothetical protein
MFPDFWKSLGRKASKPPKWICVSYEQLSVASALATRWHITGLRIFRQSGCADRSA